MSVTLEFNKTMDFHRISENEFEDELKSLYDLQFSFEFKDVKCTCCWDLSQQQVYFYALGITKYSKNKFYFKIGYIEYQCIGYSVKIHDFEIFQKKRKGFGTFFLNFFEVKLKEIYSTKIKIIAGELINTPKRYNNKSPNEIFIILLNFYRRSGYIVTRNNSDYTLGYLKKEINQG